jgi:transcriptional regulator with GAF, ATPase, and Fis domain
MNHSQTLDHRRQESAANDHATYASLSKLVYTDQPVADTLEKLAFLAKEVLLETPDVSLTLIEDKRAFTAAFAGSLALELDERQYELDHGPCLDAALYGETIHLTVSAADQPYPGLRQSAQQKGVSHTLSIGLSTGDQVRGAINIYNTTGRPFTDDSDRIARTFATCAGIVVANIDRYRQAAARAAQLEDALRSRAPIEQAKGILMTRHGCSSEEAFKMLVTLSQNENVKLRVVAQNLVEAAVPA